MKLLWRVGYLTWRNNQLTDENKRLRACNLTLGRQVLFFKDVAEKERAERRELSRNLAVLTGHPCASSGVPDHVPAEWGEQ
jgi:hypothetical protein